MVKKETDHKKKFVTVTQTGSPIGKESSQRSTLIGLGLNKIGRSRTLVETPDVMGMVTKVKHLLKVEHS
ncbi:MAG: 50S ribosomal protein L30 [Rickettsiales bacterium]